jgi:hypothetical protein
MSARITYFRKTPIFCFWTTKLATYHLNFCFAALKADGTIKTWGDPDWGGKKGAPKSNGYIKIASTLSAFTAS